MPAPKDPIKRELWIQRKSASMRGKPGYWKDKKRDEATNKKISATLQGHQLTPEQREHHLAAMQEFVENLTPEQRYEMGKGNRGKHFTEEHCTKISIATQGRPSPNKGRRYTEEEKARIYVNQIGVPAPQKGRPMPEHIKEMLFSPEIKAKRAASYSANYAAMPPEEQIERVRPWIEAGIKGARKYYAALSDEEKAAYVKRLHTGKNRDTSLERSVASQLDTQGIVYEQQKQIGPYWVDFYIPEQNTILEANGCYWHQCEQCGFNDFPERREYDRKRIEALEAQGYTVKIIWEHEIHPPKTDRRPK